MEGSDQVARNRGTCIFRAKYEISSSLFQSRGNSKIQWFLRVETDWWSLSISKVDFLARAGVCPNCANNFRAR
jgi:hypothetical protein